MNVIWLCSWYPNQVDKFRGDFIQRQAIAVSALLKVDVIHVVFAEENERTESIIVNENLTEHLYYRRNQNKLSNFKTLFSVHQNFLKKYRIEFGNPTLIHVHIPLLSGMVAIFWRWKYQLPFVLTEHYGIYNHRVDDHFEKRNFLFRFFTKQIIQSSSAFLPVSESLGNEVNQMVVAKPFTAIANVVDTTYFCRDSTFKNPIFQFIHISDMSENKNVHGILNALAFLHQIRNDFRVLFIGKKSEAILKHAAQINLMEQCEFVGEIPYYEVAEHVKKSHAGILFSQSESQSCVVLEWLCAGLPVISSRVGGVVELIQKSNGILVNPNDENELCLAMNELMNNYSKYDLNQISKDAINQYSYEAVARQIKTVYQSVLEKEN